jgi:hypothetical protein
MQHRNILQFATFLGSQMIDGVLCDVYTLSDHPPFDFYQRM